jgi:nucleotide-binding universal stress UspA family protein
VAATDESEAGRQAVRAAVTLAARSGARVTVMRAVPAKATAPTGRPSLDPDEPADDSLNRLQAWVEADIPAIEHRPAISYGVTHGLPGIEIGRFAERHGADLLVLGRKPRSRMARLVVGDTADAVGRRSQLPCLFVPGIGALPRKVLAAVDGTERGKAVLITAADFARQTGAELLVMTVEAWGDEPPDLVSVTPSGRSLALAAQVRAMGHRGLEVRRGRPVDEILLAVDHHGPDVLVIGCHRGGPPGIIDAGSTSRRLAHAAPCATLTLPL